MSAGLSLSSENRSRRRVVSAHGGFFLRRLSSEVVGGESRVRTSDLDGWCLRSFWVGGGGKDDDDSGSANSSKARPPACVPASSVVVCAFPGFERTLLGGKISPWGGGKISPLRGGKISSSLTVGDCRRFGVLDRSAFGRRSGPGPYVARVRTKRKWIRQPVAFLGSSGSGSPGSATCSSRMHFSRSRRRQPSWIVSTDTPICFASVRRVTQHESGKIVRQSSVRRRISASVRVRPTSRSALRGSPLRGFRLRVRWRTSFSTNRGRLCS